jgi:hypothetical protein
MKMNIYEENQVIISEGDREEEVCGDLVSFAMIQRKFKYKYED